MVKGLSRVASQALLKARKKCAFENVEDLVARTHLRKQDLEALAAADALKGFARHRHLAWWQVSGLEPSMALFETLRFQEPEPMLRKPQEGEDIVADYAHVGLSLRRHPVALVRARLCALGVSQACDLQNMRNNAAVRVAGLVTCRQRPGTASGVIFITLEDETDYVNVIVWPNVFNKHRKILLGARLLMVTGTVQRQGEVRQVIARRLGDLSTWVRELTISPRDFN